MNRKTYLGIGLAGAALLALLVWAFAPRPIAVESAQASLGPFETTIDEDGRTRLRERYAVSAPLAGRLQRIALREGDAVEAGTVVATLTPVLSPMLDERTRTEQRARVGAALAGLKRAAARIEATQVALEMALTELRRTTQLAQQGFIAQTKVDNDRLAVQAAQKERDTAVQERSIAGHDLEQARAALAAVDDAAGGAAFAVRAPVSGRVLALHQSSATTVPLGAPLLEIGDIGKMEIVAELLTTDALQVRPGSPVRIDRWGGPTTLQGEVRLVEPAAFTKVSALGVEEQRVKVLIAITSAPASWSALGDGYRVGVSVITRQESSVLRVPVSAVFPLPATGEGNPAGSAVFVIDGGRARLRAVTVAARNNSQVWIRAGLQAGATVIVYPPQEVSDGTRVAPRGV